jgi:hypothetical protein
LSLRDDIERDLLFDSSAGDLAKRLYLSGGEPVETTEKEVLSAALDMIRGLSNACLRSRTRSTR